MKKTPTLVVLIAIGLIGLAIDYFNLISYVNADPISNLSLALLVAAVILLPFREEVFRSWLKFFYWGFPLVLVVTMIQPDGGGGYFPALITKEIVSWWAGGIFMLVSLVLIIYKSLRLK